MWSSHQYKIEGLKLGRTNVLLENGIEQTETVFEVDEQLPSVLTLKHLSKRTTAWVY